MENYKFDGKKLLKSEYLKMQVRLAYLLRDDLADESNLDELKFTLEEDWYHDPHPSNSHLGNMTAMDKAI